MENKLILAASRIYNAEGLTAEERAIKVMDAAQEMAANGEINIEQFEELILGYGLRHYENVYGEYIYEVGRPNLDRLELIRSNKQGRASRLGLLNLYSRGHAIRSYAIKTEGQREKAIRLVKRLGAGRLSEHETDCIVFELERL